MTGDDITPGRADPGRWPRLAGWSHRLRLTPLSILIGAALVAYAWVDADAPPFTTRSLVGVVIPGAVLAAIAYRRPAQRIPPPEELDALGASYWLIVVAALFEWEASAFKDNSLRWHPSLTNLIDPLLGPHLMKTGAILVWMMAGWGLVKR